MATHTDREPVVKAAKQAGAISGLVVAVGTALGAYAALTHQQWAEASAAIVALIGTGLAGGLPVLTAIGARAQVTPVASPEAMDGTPLVPAPAPPPAPVFSVTASSAPAVASLQDVQRQIAQDALERLNELDQPPQPSAPLTPAAPAPAAATMPQTTEA